MVDERRRGFVKTVATLGALGVAGFGGKEYWWDRRDDHISPAAFEERVEKHIQKAYTDSTSLLDTDGIRANISRETYRDTGDAYQVSIIADIDRPESLCGNEDGTKADLQRDVETLFEATYDATGSRSKPAQHPFEDHVSSYVFSLFGTSGVARLEMDAQEAYQIAGRETGYNPEDPAERNAFSVFYRNNLSISC